MFWMQALCHIHSLLSPLFCIDSMCCVIVCSGNHGICIQLTTIYFFLLTMSPY